jgi:hypothetical protein
VVLGQNPGAVARQADADKRQKYGQQQVVPFALETYGTFSPSARFVLKSVVDNAIAVNPDFDRLSEKIQRMYCLQRISIALQNGNAQMILACSDTLAARRMNNSFDAYAPIVIVREDEEEGGV